MMLAKKPWRFFLDMDDVLVDLDKIFQQVWPGIKQEDEWEWQDIHAVRPNMYREAPPMADMEQLLDYIGINQARTYILTAIPRRWNWPNVTKHKREWINEHLSFIPDERIRFGPYAEDKQFHCTGQYDILIDDKLRNIEQWNAKGGIGVLHKNAANTINQLREMGI
jgi:5'(3')-deoxyribonucleotidase